MGGSAPVIIPLAGTVSPTTISLVADGRRYRVGSAYNVVLGGRGIQDLGRRSQYVAVAGDGDDLRLEVSYDGLTQQVELPSGKLRATQATALRDVQPTGLRRCRPVGELDRHGLTSVSVDCRANASVRLPYVAGLGWARSGREWAVVDVASGLGSAPPQWKRPGRPGSVRYEVFGKPASAFTVDWRAPARTILDRDQPSDSRYALRMLAFDVPAGRPATLRVRHRFELAAGNVLDADLADHLPLDVFITVDGEADI